MSSSARSSTVSLVDGDRVHPDAFLDPRVFDAEMARIFMGGWVYVAHESEIAHPGDYKTTVMGREPVIVSRDRDGALHVLVNRCSHRGAAVCQWPKGNGTAFRCHYHGWTFASDGTLVGVSYPDGYEDPDRDWMGLAAAPRVEAYRGLVFASFAPGVRPLTDHLGAALPDVDRFVEHAAGHELRVAPDAVQATCHANWKLVLEGAGPDRALPGAPPGGPPDADGPGDVTIFPNLQLAGGHLREVQPVAVDRTRLVLRPLLAAGAPAAVNRLRLRHHEEAAGLAGPVLPGELADLERHGDELAAAPAWRSASGESLHGLYRRWRERMEVEG